MLNSILLWSKCFHHSIRLKLSKIKELNYLELLFNSNDLFQSRRLESCQYDWNRQRKMISLKVYVSNWNTGKCLMKLMQRLDFWQHQLIQKYDQRFEDWLLPDNVWNYGKDNHKNDWFWWIHLPVTQFYFEVHQW